MTGYKELAARLRPNWKDDDAAGRAVSVLRSINPDLADKLNAAIVANNARKSEAASAIEALEAKWIDADEDAKVQKEFLAVADARCKRLEEALSRIIDANDDYLRHNPHGEPDALTTACDAARLALQENTNGG